MMAKVKTSCVTYTVSRKTRVMLVAVAALVTLGLPVLPAYAEPAQPITPNTSPSFVPELVKPDSSSAPSRSDEDRAREALQSATPEQREALQALLDKMDAIDIETEIAAENYNAAKERLARIRSDVKKAQDELAIVSKAHEIQTQQLAERAAALYREGEMSGWELIFSSESLGDLLRRIQYVTDIGSRDARLLGQVSIDKKRLEDTIAQLKTDEAGSASLEFELSARQIEITERSDERQKLLKKQNPELIALLTAQQTAAAADEQAVAVKIELGQYKGVTVTEGSPVETALAYRGIPYVWGGESKSGMDCSGLVLFVFRQHGVNLPHFSGAQFRMGQQVVGPLIPGDAVFFGSPIHHVGIYIGGDRYIHAPRTGDVVKISQLSSRRDYVGARRYNWTTRTAPIK